MTAKHLQYLIGTVVGVYAVAIVLGITLRVFFPPEARVYETYKDLLPLIVAIPAAYLVSGFQRRSSYMQALRALYNKLADAIASALTYTSLENPEQKDYADTLRKLSASIEEVRGVFKNLPEEGKPDGYFPFEPVRQIYLEVRELGYGSGATRDKRFRVHDRIYEMWKASRAQLLEEFERDRPTFHHAGYVRPQVLPWQGYETAGGARSAPKNDAQG